MNILNFASGSQSGKNKRQQGKKRVRFQDEVEPIEEITDSAHGNRC